MKYKRMISFMLCFICAFTLCSCAETPDKDIVVNKGEGTLEDKIENSTGSGLNIDMDTSDNSEEHDLVASFTSSGGDVTFNINADVFYPDVEAFPVLKSTIHFFTSEELEQISNVLCKGNPIYEYSEELTKSELEAQILKYKQIISDTDYLWEYYHGDEDIINSVVQMYEEHITNMKAAYANAPDVEPKIESDFQYHDDSYYYTSYDLTKGIDGVKSFKATSIVDGIPMYISAQQRNDDSYILSNIFAYIYDYRSYYHINDSGLNESDFYQTTLFDDDDIANAMPLIESTLSDMGLDEWHIYSYYVSDYSATFICTPEYYGIQMSTDQSWSALSSDIHYNPSYAFPKIEIRTSNNQIVDFWLEGPLDVTEVLNDNVELLSFSEAIERIYEQLELSWTPDRIAEYLLSGFNVDVTSASVNVSSIELTLVRVSVNNEPNNYYILPAWLIYGSMSMDEYSINGGSTIKESNSGGYSNIPLLVVNAIDGSVIDMSQGY